MVAVAVGDGIADGTDHAGADGAMPIGDSDLVASRGAVPDAVAALARTLACPTNLVQISEDDPRLFLRDHVSSLIS